MSRRWIGPVLIVLMIAFALAVYGRLPEQVPTHFGFSGEPDGWTPRFPGAFLGPAGLRQDWPEHDKGFQ